MAQQPEPEPQIADAESAVSEWLGQVSGGEFVELAAATCAALRGAGIPEDEWLSELRGVEREGQLQSFMATVGGGSGALPPPADDDVGDGGGASPLPLASATSRRSGPPDAVAAAAAAAAPPPAPEFVHIDPKDESEKAYSAEDNAAIAAARAAGSDTVRISDVVLPNGRVLHFEVRFGANAGSPKTAKMWPNGSPTGMAQVNIDDDNTRLVKEKTTLGMAPPAQVPLPQVQSSQPPPAAYTQRPPPPNADANAADDEDDPDLPVPPTMQFLHVAGPEENYRRTPYNDADNLLISDAKTRGLPSVRVGDVALPNGAGNAFCEPCEPFWFKLRPTILPRQARDKRSKS
jgi:hypothetical protein